MRYHLILLRVSIIKKTRDNKYCWFGEKKTLGHWKWKLFQLLWKIVGSNLRRLKNRTTIGFSNHSSRCISKGNKIIVSKRYLSSVFIVALCIITNMWKWPKCHQCYKKKVMCVCLCVCVCSCVHASMYGMYSGCI